MLIQEETATLLAEVNRRVGLMSFVTVGEYSANAFKAMENEGFVKDLSEEGCKAFQAVCVWFLGHFGPEV